MVPAETLIPILIKELEVKFVFILLCVLFISCNEENKVSMDNQSATAKSAKVSDKNNLPDEIAEEDCDDKIKKAEEKKIDENNLFGKNQDEGCTLE
jgi:hypothetical protein